MTGRCTGGVDLHDIQRLSSSQQRRLVRYNWCETWLDPDGDGTFTNGWVCGKHVQPA